MKRIITSVIVLIFIGISIFSIMEYLKIKKLEVAYDSLSGTSLGRKIALDMANKAFETCINDLVQK